MAHPNPVTLGEVYAQHHATGERLGKSFLEDTRAPLFREWIGQGKVILDLGGRDGTLTRHYLAGNQIVIGDIDVGAMALARETYGVDTIEVDLNQSLPFEDASYDVVVLAEVLEHLPYPWGKSSGYSNPAACWSAAFRLRITSRIAGRFCVAENCG